MKIVGNVVGMGLPKPNLKQTDPGKGDYVKGRDIIPKKMSDLQNDAQYVKSTDLDDKVNYALRQAKESGEFKPVKGVDYWTAEDKAEIAAGITVLTNEEIEMLNSLLMGGSLMCDPSITGSHTDRNVPFYGSPGNLLGYSYYTDISATITGIDKVLIQKVELGKVYAGHVYDDYTYTPVEVTMTDSGTHTVEHTDTRPGNTYYKYVIRLTYYTLFGETKTLEKGV